LNAVFFRFNKGIAKKPQKERGLQMEKLHSVDESPGGRWSA